MCGKSLEHHRLHSEKHVCRMEICELLQLLLLVLVVLLLLLLVVLLLLLLVVLLVEGAARWKRNRYTDRGMKFRMARALIW